MNRMRKKVENGDSKTRRKIDLGGLGFFRRLRVKVKVKAPSGGLGEDPRVPEVRCLYAPPDQLQSFHIYAALDQKATSL